MFVFVYVDIFFVIAWEELVTMAQKLCFSGPEINLSNEVSGLLIPG